MDITQFGDLSREQWQREMEEHRRNPRRPASQEDDERATAQIATKVLLALSIRYGKSYLKKQGKEVHGPIIVPRQIEDWIQHQVRQADSFLGHPGTRTYQSIADNLYYVLSKAEHLF
jgi:hypothetical protein